MRPRRKHVCAVKITKYFEAIRSRPDRVIIQDEWILRVIASPEREYIQADGRVHRWAGIKEMEGRCLRVILLPDRETVAITFEHASDRTDVHRLTVEGIAA
jgi:hypothetical protein